MFPIAKRTVVFSPVTVPGNSRLWTNQGECLKSALKQYGNPKHLIGQNFVAFLYSEFTSPKEFFGILDIFEKNLYNKATLYFTGWP